MIDISSEVMTGIMLGGLVGGILLGYPLAFVMGGLALIVGYGVWGVGVGNVLYTRSYEFLVNYILLAAPLFVFMGDILEYSGIADKLYDGLYVWLGGLRGGLALVTVLVGTIMAACVGIIAASITMLALVALPSMVKRGYSKSLASGSICAGGTLGILIPPSVMLVVYGPMAQVSVGKLFFGAIMPGLLLSALYMAYIMATALLRPEVAPSVPLEERKVPMATKMKTLLFSLIPPVILVGSVLGVIFWGIAPPTEAAGIGAFTAILLAIAYRRFTFKILMKTAVHTLQLCGFIFLIGAMASAFTGVFMFVGCGDVIKELILAAPGGLWSVFAVVMFIIFILGFVLDWIGIVFITVPIITPIAVALNFDPVWFAIMVCVNLQTSFMTPPFAYAIFILRGCADSTLGITMNDIIRGVIPFVICILVGFALCIAFPEIILWLPSRMVK